MAEVDPRITRLDSTSADFEEAFAKLLERSPGQVEDIARAVNGIVADVRNRGDAAVLEYTARFDHHEVATAAELELPPARCKQAWDGLAADLRQALEVAVARIRSYAEHQQLEPFEFSDEYGNRLGQRVTPLDRVGLYVPGGKAAYPSSVLMNAVPAKVAGVHELVMCVPTPNGTVNEAVLGAAHLVGVNRVFAVGGAQAVAAMAWGTQTIPPVDKIVGPGNAYVAAAKRSVFGQVGIDSVAGPSEVLIIADGGNPDTLTLDLFAQAEHDELAQAILISPDTALLDAVHQSIQRLLPRQPREAIIRTALANAGGLIRVQNLAEATELANRIAPEHLELALENPRALLPKIRHAGAIFLGHRAAEALGDYCAGPNHVLPTARAARYANPLGVYEFQKRTTLTECTAEGAAALAAIAARLADVEGLAAHAASARARQ
ncbi:MAG: histidinol dehydrogenase [Sinobacteraceae bacterium]|nr:histidinol dehydrogenase [Nevskiaceae bacterium]